MRDRTPLTRGKPAIRRQIPLTLGAQAERAAERHPAAPLWLDRPLDTRPSAGAETTAAGSANPHAAGIEMTFADFAAVVLDAAAWMHGIGLGRGAVVAIVKRNGLDTVALSCAAARVGAVPALISPAIDRDAVPTLLGRLGRPVLVTDEAAAGFGCLAGHDLSALSPRTVAVGGEVAGAVASEELPRKAPPAVERDLGEPVLVTHTSGTTGVPKLVLHSGRSLFGQVRPQLTIARILFGSSDRVAGCFSWAHVRAITAWMTASERGLPLLAVGDPAPDNVRTLFAAHRPTYVEATPNTLLDWERLADDAARPFAHVRIFLNTFDRAHPRTIAALLDASDRRVPFYVQAYGQTETGPITFRFYTRRLARAARAGSSVGLPLPGVTRARVVDPETGRRLRAGQRGRIEAKTPGLAETYLGQEDLAAGRRRDDGWWDMGDVGYRTRFGALHLTDRREDVVQGVASTLEVEDLLLERLPELREVVLVGTEDGPTPVVCTAEETALDRSRWARATEDLRELAAPVQVPWDELPHTATLKVKRHVLKGRLAGAR